MRDPEALGKAYLHARRQGKPIEVAVREFAPEDHGDQDVISRYGSCNDVKEKWMEIQVR